MRSQPSIQVIPENMVRGKFLRGDILCSYIEKGDKKIGVRFYKFGGYEKKKGIKSYSTFMTKEIIFPPKKRIGSEDFTKIVTELQTLEKGFESDQEENLFEIDLDKLIQSTKFFSIK